MSLTLRLAWRNLWRNRRRTLLTIAALAFGTALVIASMSLRQGAYVALVDQAVRLLTGHVQVQAPDYQREPILRHDIPHSRALADELRARVPEYGIAERAIGFALLASDRQTLAASLVGVDLAHEARVSALPERIERGRFLRDGPEPEVVLGETLARNLEAEVGDRLTMLGTGRDGSLASAELVIVGVFRSGVPELDRSLAQMPLSVFQQLFSMNDSAQALIVRGPAGADPAGVLARVRAALESRDELVVLGWDDILPGTRELIELDFAASIVFYLALIGVVTLGIFNTFLMSVLERTREFGVVLALGIAPIQLVRVVVVETAMLVTLGVAIGSVLGTLADGYFLARGFAIPGMAEFARGFGLSARLYPVVSAKTLLTGPLLVLGIGFIAACLPALRIRRLEPIAAMRSV
jgi:ABC-type lipoprotein release transport system permease subunit